MSQKLVSMMPKAISAIEAEFDASSRALPSRRGKNFVEAGVQNHAGDAVDLVFGVAHRARLLDRFRRTADQVLHLLLDPEVRRIIRDVGQNGDERHARE